MTTGYLHKKRKSEDIKALLQKKEFIKKASENCAVYYYCRKTQTQSSDNTGVMNFLQ